MASFLVQLQKCGITFYQKRDSITTEHQLYRTMLIYGDILNVLLALSVINQLSYGMEI